MLARSERRPGVLPVHSEQKPALPRSGMAFLTWRSRSMSEMHLIWYVKVYVVKAEEMTRRAERSARTVGAL